MVSRDIEGVASLGVQPQHILDAVGLGRDDPGHAARVIHLAANGVLLDQLADRHQPTGGADQSVIRLARADLLRRGCPDVEPDRRVEAEHLMDEGVLELMVENLGVPGGGEVAVLDARRHVDADHPVDQLLEAPLTLRGADRAAEVLGGHDVGGVDRPEIGEFHTALLEVDRAVPPVGHQNVAAFPGHIVVRVHAVPGVDALYREPLASALAAPCRPARRLGHCLPLLGLRRRARPRPPLMCMSALCQGVSAPSG